MMRSCASAKKHPSDRARLLIKEFVCSLATLSPLSCHFHPSCFPAMNTPLPMKTRGLLGSNLRARSAHRTSGFSLLEILIAIALVALITSVALNQLTDVFGGNQKKAAEMFVTSTAELALTRYRLDVGNFPSTEEGLDALIKAPAGKEPRWKGPYFKEKAIDPWGNAYKYQFPGTRNISGARSYDIWSLGEDGTESNDDIGNWNSSQ